MADSPPPPHPPLERQHLLEALRSLEVLADDLTRLDLLTSEERIRLLIAVGRITKPDQIELRKRIRANRRAAHEMKRNADRTARATAGIRRQREQSVYTPLPRISHTTRTTSETAELSAPENCYVCKAPFSTIHHFYDSMCQTCGDLNYEKRFQSADLTGRVALITGARVKIGYQAALLLLRAGARVLVTTRFPRDAADRYSKEADFNRWRDRLQIYGLDLRHSPSVESFAQHLVAAESRLDFLINNAAQTVRRPPQYYAHLLEGERRRIDVLPETVRQLLEGFESLRTNLSDPRADTRRKRALHPPGVNGTDSLPGLSTPAEMSQLLTNEEESDHLNRSLFPEGLYDSDLQQIDLRENNSWRLKLAQVSTHELIEVQLINAIAPFVLCAKLKPLMLRVPTRDKHIINVSAMEGKFARHTKTDRHPHTNMAKAALNMMTLTSARDYAQDGIFMNAVDTGWVTDEDPAIHAERKVKELDFQPPLDIIDGAARILDPIFTGFKTGDHPWGNFFKDYQKSEW